jgi:hypothetical protein
MQSSTFIVSVGTTSDSMAQSTKRIISWVQNFANNNALHCQDANQKMDVALHRETLNRSESNCVVGAGPCETASLPIRVLRIQLAPKMKTDSMRVLRSGLR